MKWMLSLGLAGLCCMAVHAAPVPVILDTDLGDDIDDTWALCQALGDPRMDVKLIVTASHNTPLKARLVGKILEKIGRTDIPLGIGKKTEDAAINQAAWLGDYTLDKYPGKVHEDGVGAMIDLIRSQPAGHFKLCAIGPLPNLEEALKRAPDIAEKTDVTLMAGSVRIGYNGKATPDPEWNVVCNIPAARAVFAAPWKITIAPLDVCGTLRLEWEEYLRVKNSGAPRARAVIENYDVWKHRGQYPADGSSVLFDTTAIELLVSDSLMAVETLNLAVDDKGMTVVDEAKGRPVRCAMGWRDEGAFKQALIGFLTRP